MRKILLTGFTPFDGEERNPSWEAVKAVKSRIEDVEVLKLELPTVFGKSFSLVKEVIEKEKPDFVLLIGQAGGRAEITPERVAINLDDARIPENEGNKPEDQCIFSDGENAYFSTLPIKAMVSEIKKEGVPARISNTAGTFVCNHLFYSVLYLVKKQELGISAGFMHVPFIPEQTKEKKESPSLPLSSIVRGVEAAIHAIVTA